MGPIITPMRTPTLLSSLISLNRWLAVVVLGSIFWRSSSSVVVMVTSMEISFFSQFFNDVFIPKHAGILGDHSHGLVEFQAYLK
jgi:hypothetical protein